MTQRSSIFSRVKASILNGDRWLKQTPERSLEQAYEAALRIQTIEDEHFQGQKIALEFSHSSETVFAYFKGELQQCLTTLKVRLAEFRLSYPIVGFFSPDSNRNGYLAQRNGNGISARDRTAMILEKLTFIDAIAAKYAENQVEKSLVPVTTSDQPSAKSEKRTSLTSRSDNAETLTDKTGLLPRSILGTFTRIRSNLDPEAESKIVKDYRVSRTKTIVSFRFLLLLVVITLATQVVSKALIVGPIVDRVRNDSQLETIFLNQDLEAEAFQELHRYEEELRFQALIGLHPPLSSDVMDSKLKERADELADRFRYRSADAVKNVFADLLSIVGFVIFILLNRTDLEVFKSFFDEIFYGLSDSAKAFILILLTDIFVGFHSPHGWEVLLEGLFRHLGLPENRELIFIFIATIPVILDTTFKYWIFRYLNRVSPSAVATLHSMNE
jgi:hypothetical protein